MLCFVSRFIAPRVLLVNGVCRPSVSCQPKKDEGVMGRGEGWWLSALSVRARVGLLPVPLATLCFVPCFIAQRVLAVSVVCRPSVRLRKMRGSGAGRGVVGLYRECACAGGRSTANTVSHALFHVLLPHVRCRSVVSVTVRLREG